MSGESTSGGATNPPIGNVPVSLQINLAPTDLPHLEAILPHELKQFGGQVAEILLVLDLDRHATIRQSVWDQGLAGIRALATVLSERYPHLRLVEVDASPAVSTKVAEAFFGGRSIPFKDWRGAPIYPYFFGIWAARERYVLHMDSDMLFGGGSQTWVSEAVALLEAKPQVLVCSPLPGPPTRDGELTTQSLPREPYDTLAFRAQEVSTRIFLIDRDRFRERVGTLEPLRPSRKNMALARIDGYQAHETAEMLLTSGLKSSGLARVDFLGSGAGMWSLHPPYRSQLFYRELPRLIREIESGEVPEAQRGDYDVNDSMIDWSLARPTKTDRAVWHARRLLRRLRA